MTRGARRLTNEEIEQIIQDKWTPIQEREIKDGEPIQYKNLTGAKTKEGKKRSLQNLITGSLKGGREVMKIKNAAFLKQILTEEELELYMTRREEYLKDYDINGSADEITLHTALMEEVMYHRLMLLQARDTKKDYSPQINACVKRLNQALENLGALRKQRIKQNENTHVINIATISKQFARELIQGSLQQELEAMRREEQEFLENRKMAIDGDVIDAEVVEEGGDADE